MVEGGVDHAVAGGGAPGQDVAVIERAAHDLGPGRFQLARAGVGTRQTQNPMPVGDQLLDDGRSDEPGGAGDENTHGRDLGGFHFGQTAR